MILLSVVHLCVLRTYKSILRSMYKDLSVSHDTFSVVNPGLTFVKSWFEYYEIFSINAGQFPNVSKVDFACKVCMCCIWVVVWHCEHGYNVLHCAMCVGEYSTLISFLYCWRRIYCTTSKQEKIFFPLISHDECDWKL